MGEVEYKVRVFSRLEHDFDLIPEVWGTHFSGKRLRLDAIAIPKVKQSWKNPNVVLGIEFKDEMRLRDTTHYTQWLAQCVDYAHTKWDQFGYIFIFACPGLLEGIHTTATVGDNAWLLARMMSHLGIGELRFDPRYGLTFFLQQSHRIWSQHKGVESGRIWSLVREFGSR